MEASELLDGQSPMASDLQEGVRTIALNQEITFRLYGRVVLPIDGFVFWVKAQLLKQKPFRPANGLVTAPQLSDEEMDPCELKAMCSLHFATDFRQEEAENYAANRVLLTTKDEVQDLNEVAPGTMWIADYKGLRFGFSAQNNRYQQAGLWHYSGFALYPDMGPQIVDRVQDFSSAQVVSNSLPAWLAIQAYRPPWAKWSPIPPMFPSFLVPDNEPPPFVSVHVLPEATKALASMPTIDSKTSTHTQLATDTVRVTLWGTRNFDALDFVDAVNQYSSDTGAIGIMNTPIPRDDKRVQPELRTIAMKKVIDYEVSYLQRRMNTIARQRIVQAIMDVNGDEIVAALPKTSP